MLVKKFAFGFVAAAVMGLSALSAPASAATVVQSRTVINAPAPVATPAAYVVRRTVVRRGPVCSMRTVVRRGPMGRRVVTKTRVCR